MNYYTKELWEKLNSPDEAIRRAAENEWTKCDAEYGRHFESIKKHLPHKFLKAYLEFGDLHDYILEEISFGCEGSRHLCRLRLSAGAEKILITMDEVSAVSINVPTFRNCVMGKMAWGYSEFDLSSKGCIKLSLMCDMSNEMEFEFKKISMEKLS